MEIFLLKAKEVGILVTAIVGYHPPDFLWISSNISSFKPSLIFFSSQELQYPFY